MPRYNWLRQGYFLAPLLSCLLLLPAIGVSQASKPDSAAPPTPKKDPAALAALERMGKALAGKNNFAYHADLVTEVVLENGQKILVTGTSEVQFRRPDHIRIELSTPGFKRQLFHDGNKLTLFDPVRNYFGTIDQKGDTRTAMMNAAQQYGLEFPLLDLIEWGTDKAPKYEIEEAFLVGTTEIDGKEVEHWAIRGPRMDWEIWIPTGDNALPVRLSTVNRDIKEHPRFFAKIHWKDAGELDDKRFEPQLPEAAKQISFEKLKVEKDSE